MTSTINNNDPSVHYSDQGWEKYQQKYGWIHAPIVNNPADANLTLEFDGTGVAVVGLLNTAEHDNVQDLLRCAVDTSDTPPPTPLSNAQPSTLLTFCSFTSLSSAHHTLRVLPGSSANSNPLISGFVVFSDSTSTPVAPPATQSTLKSDSQTPATKDTTSPPPTPASQLTSSVGQTSMTTGSPSASSPPSTTPMLSRTLQSTTSTTTHDSYTTPPTSSTITIPASRGHSSGTRGAPGGQTTPILSDTPSQRPHHPNTAAIAGGIVGGIILLLLILAAIFYSHRRLRALGRRIITSRRTSPVERKVEEPEQERDREQGKERDDMSMIKPPALKAWSPEMFSVQSPSHSLSPTSLDYAFTRPFSLASSVYPSIPSQSHPSDSCRSSTKPLLSSTLRGNSRTSTGTAASTNEDWHDAQSSASAEDLSMRSVPSRQSWYAV